MPLIPISLLPDEEQAEITDRFFVLTRKLIGALDRIDQLERDVKHQQEALNVVTGNLSRALDRLDRDEDSIRILTGNLSRALDRIDALEKKR